MVDSEAFRSSGYGGGGSSGSDSGGKSSEDSSSSSQKSNDEPQSSTDSFGGQYGDALKSQTGADNTNDSMGHDTTSVPDAADQSTGQTSSPSSNNQPQSSTDSFGGQYGDALKSQTGADNTNDSMGHDTTSVPDAADQTTSKRGVADHIGSYVADLQRRSNEEVTPHAYLSLDESGVKARSERERTFARRARSGFDKIRQGKAPNAREAGALWFNSAELGERGLSDFSQFVEGSSPTQGFGPKVGDERVGDVPGNVVGGLIGFSGEILGSVGQLPVTASADLTGDAEKNGKTPTQAAGGFGKSFIRGSGRTLESMASHPLSTAVLFGIGAKGESFGKVGDAAGRAASKTKRGLRLDEFAADNRGQLEFAGPKRETSPSAGKTSSEKLNTVRADERGDIARQIQEQNQYETAKRYGPEKMDKVPDFRDGPISNGESANDIGSGISGKTRSTSEFDPGYAWDYGDEGISASENFRRSIRAKNVPKTDVRDLARIEDSLRTSPTSSNSINISPVAGVSGLNQPTGRKPRRKTGGGEFTGGLDISRTDVESSTLFKPVGTNGVDTGDGNTKQKDRSKINEQSGIPTVDAYQDNTPDTGQRSGEDSRQRSGNDTRQRTNGDTVTRQGQPQRTREQTREGQKTREDQMPKGRQTQRQPPRLDTPTLTDTSDFFDRRERYDPFAEFVDEPPRRRRRRSSSHQNPFDGFGFAAPTREYSANDTQESVLLPGWENETIVDLALGGSEGPAPSQQDLESYQGIGSLTGELPTFEQLNGSKKQKKKIKEVQDLFDGGLDLGVNLF